MLCAKCPAFSATYTCGKAGASSDVLFSPRVAGPASVDGDQQRRTTNIADHRATLCSQHGAEPPWPINSSLYLDGMCGCRQRIS